MSPLYWAIRDGKFAIAEFLIRDVLMIRADRSPPALFLVSACVVGLNNVRCVWDNVQRGVLLRQGAGQLCSVMAYARPMRCPVLRCA
eukprot:388948-Rhodomonas_salina.2